MKKCRVILSVGETLSMVYTSITKGNVKIIHHAEYNVIDYINNGVIKDEFQIANIVSEELKLHKKEYQVEGVSVLLPPSLYTEDYVTVENDKKTSLANYFKKTYFKNNSLNPATELADWVKVGDVKITTSKGISKASLCLVSKLDSKKSYSFLNLLLNKKVPVDHVMSPGLGISNIATLCGEYEDSGKLVVYTGDTKTILVITQNGFPIMYREFKKGALDLKQSIMATCKVDYEVASYLLKVLGVNEDLDLLEYLQAEREKAMSFNRYAVRMSAPTPVKKEETVTEEEKFEPYQDPEELEMEMVGLTFGDDVDVDDVDALRELQEEEEEEEDALTKSLRDKGFTLAGFSGLTEPEVKPATTVEPEVKVVASQEDEAAELFAPKAEIKEAKNSAGLDFEFESPVLELEDDFDDDEEAPALHLRAQESDLEDDLEDELDEEMVNNLSHALVKEVGSVDEEDEEDDFAEMLTEVSAIKSARRKSVEEAEEAEKVKKNKHKKSSKGTKSKEGKGKVGAGKHHQMHSVLLDELRLKLTQAPTPELAKLTEMRNPEDLPKLLKRCGINIDSLRAALKNYFKGYLEQVDSLVNLCSEKEGITIDTVTLISTEIYDLDLLLSDYLAVNLNQVEFVKDKPVTKDKLMVSNVCEELPRVDVINIGGSLSFLQKKGAH